MSSSGLILKVAARNLRRHTRRTLITASAISVGLAFLIFATVLQDGMHRDSVQTAVGLMSGHVVVQGKGYQQERDEHTVVPHGSAVKDKVQAAFPDDTVVTRLFLGGLLTSPSGAMGVGLTAVDPDIEVKVSDLHERIVEGRYVGHDDTDIVIGVTLAETLGVGLGDKVVLMMQSGSDIESRLFRVRGIFKSGAAEMDGFFGIITIPAAQQLLGVGDGVSQVSLVLDYDRDLEASRQRVHAAVKDELARDEVEVLTWPEAMPQVYEYIVLDDASMWIFLLILGFIAAIGVLNTVLMSVLERVREFGVMLSLGISRRRLAAIVFTEGALLGILAGLLGEVLGIAFAYWFGVKGLDYSGLMGGETMEVAGVAISSMIYGYIAWWKMAVFFVITVIVTMLAVLYPVWWTSRLTPIDAMARR